MSRSSAKDYRVVEHSTWLPKVMAGIGELPPTLEDRAIHVRLRRLLPGERKTPLRLDRLQEFDPLRERCAQWAREHMDDLRTADPDVSESLNHRAADNWRPLLAIADALGGEWPALARQAAQHLSGSYDDADDELRLLEDLRTLLIGAKLDRVRTSSVTDALNGLPDAPWANMNDGRGITSYWLAKHLKPYGIRPSKLWFPSLGASAQGYLASDFADAFARYLKPLDTTARSPEGPESPEGGCASHGSRSYPPPALNARRSRYTGRGSRS